MGGDFTQPRPSYFSGCMSPSCVPVHEEYSRIDIHRRGKRLRKLIKKIMSEGKTIYGSKPLTFQYDAVSYAQNFDEGCHKDDQYHPRCQQVFPPEHRRHVLK